MQRSIAAAQIRRALDALGVPAERARHLGVAPADPVRGVALDRVGHPLGVAAHQPVVEDDREDRECAADGGLEVHADHAERDVAHDVDESQSGRARRAPIARPRPVPSCVDLPQPR